MITLTIKRTDGTVYWTEHFNLQADCDKWIATETSRPYWDKTLTWTAVDDSPPPKTPQQIAQDQTNVDALAYLASTDWYIIRETETGVPCPADIKQARADARARIVR